MAFAKLLCVHMEMWCVCGVLVPRHTHFYEHFIFLVPAYIPRAWQDMYMKIVREKIY